MSKRNLRPGAPNVDTDGLMASSNAGLAAITAGLNEKRAFITEAKLCCTKCNKQETSKTPLQACSRCRSVRYCGKECQLEHYKITHKRDCANFQDPPLCRAFNCKSILPGCSYTERPIFSRGVKNGMGCWISVGGSIDCRLATLPGGLKGRPDRNGPPPSMEQMMALIPGAMDGRILSLTILVQNRTPKATPMVVAGRYFVAMGTPAGTPILMEGKTEGEKSIMFDGPNKSRCVGQTVVSVELTTFNGKQVKDTDSCPAILDQSCCAVLLKAGDYALYAAEFRCGGPTVTRDFQALELLDHIVVPAVPYDPAFAGPYTDLVPNAANKGLVSDVRAKMDQNAIAAWYNDYKTKGERAHIASHVGEARANMIGSGHDALAEMLRMVGGTFGMPSTRN